MTNDIPDHFKFAGHNHWDKKISVHLDMTTKNVLPHWQVQSKTEEWALFSMVCRFREQDWSRHRKKVYEYGWYLITRTPGHCFHAQRILGSVGLHTQGYPLENCHFTEHMTVKFIKHGWVSLFSQPSMIGSNLSTFQNQVRYEVTKLCLDILKYGI